jgi:hypothetical protein
MDAMDIEAAYIHGYATIVFMFPEKTDLEGKK